MLEDIVHNSSLSGGITGGRSPEGVVTVLALRHQSRAAMVSHAGEQVTIRLVGLRQRHVIRLGELVQQVGAGQILIAKHLGGATMQEGCATEANVFAVFGRDVLLSCTLVRISISLLEFYTEQNE